MPRSLDDLLELLPQTKAYTYGTVDLEMSDPF